MSLVYLAGPIGGLTWEEANGWRTYVTELLKPLNCLSPLRDIEVDGKMLSLKGFTNTSDKKFLSNSRASGDLPFQILFDRDYRDVDFCNFLFVNMIGAKKKSTGTIMEVSRAFKRGIPMVLAMEPGNANEDIFFETHFNHSYYPSARVHTLKEAVNYVRRVFRLPVYDFGDGDD